MGKTCSKCAKPFDVTQNDLDFLRKVSPVFGDKNYIIPSSTLCDDCRLQKRLSFRNERKLYSNRCDLCKKGMISIYSPDKPYTIYCPECWWSDKWNPFAFGLEFDFSKPFFKHMGELWEKVPLIGLWQIQCENSKYNNNCFSLKDSYMNFNTDCGRNNFYCYVTENSNDVYDCAYTYKCELCYECIDSRNAYNCAFSQQLESCQDCYFSSDLVGCNRCFGCHGLRHKELYIYNKKVTKEQWDEFFKKLVLTSKRIDEIKEKSAAVKLTVPKINTKLIQCEYCSGDNLHNCRNATNCFDVENGENIKNVIYGVVEPIHNVQDAYALGGVDWAYEYLGGGLNTHRVAFINNSFNGLSDSYYCVLCVNGSKNLFGCIGLKKQRYCILNKQYGREEYDKLVTKIIEHMKKTGEWGEFFSPQLSPFGYNETIADEYYPLTKELVLFNGHKYKDTDSKEYQKQTYVIPENIKDVPDQIIKEILACISCLKNFKITSQELKFYRSKALPIPHKCPDCRHKDHLHLRNPRKLFWRECAKCASKIQTTFAPENPEIVYCKQCYLKEVY